jgi:hypothetical protein
VRQGDIICELSRRKAFDAHVVSADIAEQCSRTQHVEIDSHGVALLGVAVSGSHLYEDYVVGVVLTEYGCLYQRVRVCRGSRYGRQGRQSELVDEGGFLELRERHAI